MNIQLPSNISVSSARLPVTYESAKSALANCARIDECQEWASKAEAIAAYARMANDDALGKLADRIQARAVRRCGELLKQFDARGGDQSKSTGSDTFAPAGGERTSESAPGPEPISQKKAAAKAGLSKRQQVTAVRVANVPQETFEAAVESEKPPSVTKLAEMGKKVRETPQGFKEATAALGAVRRFAMICAEHDPAFVAGGVLQSELAEVRDHIAVIDRWLDRFIVNLGDKP